MEQMDVTMKIAEGMDALTNGKGFDIHHERARVLANTAPELLRKARAVIGSWEKGDLADAVRDLAESVTKLDDLDVGTTFPDSLRKE